MVEQKQKTHSVQRRIDRLADHYANNEISLEKYLEELSFVVAKDKREINKKLLIVRYFLVRLFFI